MNQFFATLQRWVVERAARQISRPAGLTRQFRRPALSLLEGSLLLSRLDAHKSSLVAAEGMVQKAG